jgi:sialic acid synthase SpsE
MTYIVAEIGQNHNGSVDLAKELIRMAADPRPHANLKAPVHPVDAVKMTMRYLREECTDEMMAQPYTSQHSYGATYGEHREALELTIAEHAECFAEAVDAGLEFVETFCHPILVEEVVGKWFMPHRIKVASRDLTNIPLLRAVGETGVPVILSTGMATITDIDHAITAVGHDDLSLLHCISSYPASFSSLNLARIPRLQQLFGYDVGYSDHSVGIVAPVCAVSLGATIVEKHVTLDRTSKGSDHACSLERDGLWRMVRDIRNAEDALGSRRIRRHPATREARKKLERYAVLANDVDGPLSESDFKLLSTGSGGMIYREALELVGREPTRPLKAGEVLTVDAFD